MAFYILKRDTGETYAMNIVLSDEEAQRYGHEGETVPVRAVCAWTTRANLENLKTISWLQNMNRTPPSLTWLETCGLAQFRRLD
jgi:hypothetical protein